MRATGISWRAGRLAPFATSVDGPSVLWSLLEPRWLGVGTVSFLTGFVLGAFAGDLALPL